jgi:thimet oligopeptidase
MNQYSLAQWVVSVFFIGGLAACSPSQTAQQKPIEAAIEAPKVLEWQHYDDQNAQDFITSCKTDIDLATRYFNLLAESQAVIPDLALLAQMNELDIVLDRVAGRAQLYEYVHPTAPMREAGGHCQKHLVELINDVTLSRPIYDRLLAVDVQQLSPVNARYRQRGIEVFQLAGVGRSESERNRIRELNHEILNVGQEFNRIMREDVRTIEVEPAQLAGLPQDFIKSHPVNEQGLVTLTTDTPDYIPVMQYAHSDDLRKQLHVAFRARGYPKNNAVLKDLLQKRYELANLLGFPNYAEYITSNQMIGSEKNASDFIEKINQIAKPRAAQDYDTLLNRLKKIQPTATQVEEWQEPYLKNLIKNEVYDVDAQEVRQYFSYHRVKQGIFGLVQHMFGVRIQPWKTDVWHPSVEAYEIWDGNKLIGQFYLDMHPRDGKYQHAAHFGIRTGVAGIQTPISALVCNFPSGDSKTALMEHRQVETFLHEFGHLIHSMFGGHQPWLTLSGVSTERDFVEAPSQMLEEWVWDTQTLQTFAINSQGEFIPDSLVKKMNSARSFGEGIFTRQQMFYAALSLNYYNQDPALIDLDKAMIELQEIYSPFEYVEDTFIYANFGHLDGYSAMYYTYMWSSVIAYDLFSEFEKSGLRDQALAARYRKTILEQGGAKPAAQLVADFLGRPYSFDAFARNLNKSH